MCFGDKDEKDNNDKSKIIDQKKGYDRGQCMTKFLGFVYPLWILILCRNCLTRMEKN